MVNDPVADLLTRIRNAQKARHRSVTVPNSKMIKSVLEVLKREGFIENYSAKENLEESGNSELKFGSMEVVLRYYDTGEPVISRIERISTPGKRVYAGVEELPRVFSGLGISIVSTSQGLMSDREARKNGVGGELIARVG